MHDANEGPLEGIRVLDFSHIAAGPYGTLQLGYFGADVIKVESHQRPDGWRIRDGQAHIEASLPFADHNKNKRGLSIDLKHPRARIVLDRLLECVDVVVDNFSVGVMDRLGLGHERLRRDFPRLVVATVPGMGSLGPHRHWVTWGPSIMPMSGLTYLWNHANWAEPVGSQTSYPDYVVGTHLAALIVAALATRDLTGQGSWIDISQAEVAATLLAPYYMAFLQDGIEPEPTGNHDSVYVPSGCYPCQGTDRWCVLAVTNDAQWHALCRLLEQEAWTSEPRFRTFHERQHHADELDREISKWTQSQDAVDVMQRCQKAGIPAGIVATAEDLVHDPQLQWRHFFVDTHHPYLPGIALPGCPVELSGTPANYSRHAPLIGQDTRDIMCDLAGLSQREFDELEREGVFN